MAYISGISYYTPAHSLTNEMLKNKYPQWDVKKFEQMTGIKNRFISAPDEFTSDMAIKASNSLFQEFNIDKNTIDFIILCTQTPDYTLPSTACIVQDALGLPTTTGALDVNLGCSGYVYCLALAKGLIDTGICEKILLITSEVYSKYIHPNDKTNQSIFGDAATASLITKAKGMFQLNEFVFGTDGSGANNLIVKEGAGRSLKRNFVETYDNFGNVLSDSYLYVNGNNIFNFSVNAVPKLVNQVIEKNRLKFEDVNYFLFHQANSFILEHVRKKMNIPVEKFIKSIEKFGNTTSSTIPIAFKEYQMDHTFTMGDKILLSGYGVGYSWSGCVIEAS